jgi:hypothetical protein
MKKIMALFGYAPINTVEINRVDLNNMVKFLNYSFKPIEYKYDNLTVIEKTLVTREQFERIVKILK